MSKWFLNNHQAGSAIYLVRRWVSNGYCLSIVYGKLYKDRNLGNGEDYDDHVKPCE